MAGRKNGKARGRVKTQEEKKRLMNIFEAEPLAEDNLIIWEIRLQEELSVVRHSLEKEEKRDKSSTMCKLLQEEYKRLSLIEVEDYMKENEMDNKNIFYKHSQ